MRTLLIALLLCLPAAAQNRRGPDKLDVEAGKKIRKYTTSPAYLTRWVDHLPVSKTVPSPQKFLGYVIGTPNRLTAPTRINAYFHALAKASDRVQVFSMGRSHGGREMIVAAIADPVHLRDLAAIKRANALLADPRMTGEKRAREISRLVPPIYWITAGLHSPETGPPEMVMELAYRLAVSEQRHIREIRKGVVTLISPVLEMDGRARMVDWWKRHLTQHTDRKNMPPRMAPFWGDYTAHDNNRDGLQQSQPLTRNYTDLYHEYLPVVSLDLHESVPLLYVSMGTGPYNPTIDPITVSEWQWISGYEVSQATRLGLRGVWTWGFYTGWYPGYLLWVTNNHNANGRFYETFGNGHPGTFTRSLRRSSFAGKRTNSRQWYRPWPPAQSVRWSLRNNTNYMQSGVLASLQLVARNGEQLLFNFWRKSLNSLNKGRAEAPYAFVIPAKQRDRGNLAHLLWLLARHRIEVHQNKAGDFVVRMNQPYRNFARTLLMKRDFPKSAALAPYDDVAWSLDYMLGLEIQAIDDKAILGKPARRLKSPPSLPGAAAQATEWIVTHKAQTRLASLRWALPKNAEVEALSEPWMNYPRGSLLIRGPSQAQMQALCARFGIDAAARPAQGQAPATIPVDLPRVALYHSWRYTQDSGWARYTLEQLGIPYTLINKDHLRRGKLDKQFDLILLPSQGRLDFKSLVHGIQRKWGPLAYTKTPRYPSHGIIDSSPDITGGMGFEGLRNLQRFVQSGGLLIALGSGGRLPADSGIARNVTLAQPAGLSNPGSHLTVKQLRPEHPTVWGYKTVTHVFRGNHPLYQVRDNDRGMVVLQYGTKTALQTEQAADRKADIPVKNGKPKDKPQDKKSPPLLLSGLLKGADKLERQAAILDVPVGKGRVLFYSWNPLHRHQNQHDFPFLTNALLFWNDFPKRTPTEQEMRQRENG